MAKYSTGGGSGTGEGDACELCGDPTDNLTDATIAGARLAVCPSCRPHDDPGADEGGTDRAPTQSDASAPPDAPPSRGSSPLWDSDTSHWEEGGTGYDSDPLPYLVPNYGERVRRAREAAGLSPADAAAEIGITEREIEAIEAGTAATSGIRGSAVSAVEETLDITLTE